MQFNNEEIEIFKKISEWPKCVEISTKKLEPHRSLYIYMSYHLNFIPIGIWEKMMLKKDLSMMIKQ